MSKLVSRLQIVEKKGEPPKEQQCIYLKYEKGILGDRFFREGFPGPENHRRDVCLYRKEILEWAEKQEVRGFCFAKMKANMILEGFEKEELRPGRILQFPNAKIEISDIPKHCEAGKCDFAKTGRICLLRGEYLMGRILEDGYVCKGDSAVLV